MGQVGTIFVTSFVISFALIVFFFTMTGTDGYVDLTVNKYYYDDYLGCKEELKKLTPECPACECKQGVVGFFYSIFGMMIFFGSMIYFWHKKNELSNMKKRRKK